MNNPDYSKCDNVAFDEFLHVVIRHKSADDLLDVPGVYELVAEHFNNEILDLWSSSNPDLAFPDDDDAEEDNGQ